jgi:hypothetical protein
MRHPHSLQRMGRRPKAWPDLVQGVSVLQAIAWLVFAVACVALLMHHGWRAHLAFIVLTGAALALVRWRRARSALRR